MVCLLVDPSITMRRIITHILRSAGFETILEAGDAGEAAAHLGEQGNPLSLMITEWDLPAGSGLDLVAQLRGNQESAETPVLMLTARNSREEVMQAVEAGVDGYVLKPFSPELLRAKIDQALPARIREEAKEQETQPKKAA